jgi:hypothetical protein
VALAFPGRLSDQCVLFLKASLQARPEERPTVDELLRHPWLA